jgi:hypothetical protein
MIATFVPVLIDVTSREKSALFAYLSTIKKVIHPKRNRLFQDECIVLNSRPVV